MTASSTSTSDTCFTLSQATNIKTKFTSFLHIFTIRLLPCRMLIGLLIILYLFILFYNGFFSFLSISTVEKTEMEKRHARVKRSTKNVDIFTKDFLIVPVHLTNHWILAIIFYPGLVIVNANQPRRSKRLASQATVNIIINLSLPIFSVIKLELLFIRQSSHLVLVKNHTALMFQMKLVKSRGNYIQLMIRA